MRLLLGLPYLFILLTACQEPEFGGDTPEPGAAIELPYRIVGLPEKDRFQVVVHLDALPAGTDVSRASRFGTSRNLYPSNREKPELIEDSEVLAGEVYIYQGRNPSGDIAFQSSVRIPSDIVVSGSKTFEEIGIQSSKFAGFRIYLENDAVLSSNGAPIDLRLAEIHSEGGTINSTPSGAAPSGNIGIRGGDIKISLKRVSGKLLIRSAGQTGGQGVKGVKGLKGRIGETGPSVRAGEMIHECSYQGDPDYEGLRRALWDYATWEKHHRGRGKQGHQGEMGFVGGAGATGGSAGTISVDIPERFLKELDVSAAGGVGGLGGVGGDGGDGGDGGLGGPISENDRCYRGRLPCCKTPPRGPVGAPGVQGPSGPQGASGLPGQIYLNGVLQGSEVLQ